MGDLWRDLTPKRAGENAVRKKTSLGVFGASSSAGHSRAAFKGLRRYSTINRTPSGLSRALRRFQNKGVEGARGAGPVDDAISWASLKAPRAANDAMASDSMRGLLGNPPKS